MKKTIAWILVLVLALSLAACGKKEAPKAGVSFTVVVTDMEGNETTFNYTSDKENVGDALLAEGLIAGDDSEYGLMVNTVNGVTADWDKDQTYWAFYINGEYAMTGVSQTPLEEGATYGFTLTKG